MSYGRDAGAGGGDRCLPRRPHVDRDSGPESYHVPCCWSNKVSPPFLSLSLIYFYPADLPDQKYPANRIMCEESDIEVKSNL